MAEQNSVSTKVLYPGTFDPPTLGHISLIQRSIASFGHTVVAVAKSSGKNTLFNYKERIELLKEIFKGNQDVEIVGFDGLLVHFAKETGINRIIRGLRTVSDFDYEYRMATTNALVWSEIETIFLMSEPEFNYISSTLVKTVAKGGGDISAFVPSIVEKAYKELKSGSD